MVLNYFFIEYSAISVFPNHHGNISK